MRQLGVSEGHVGLLYLVAGLAGVIGSYGAGNLSDRVGRKPVIVWASAFSILGPAVLFVDGHNVVLGLLVLVSATFLASIQYPTTQTLIPDLLTEERREAGFASFRVAINIGATIGPLISAGLVLLSWRTFFAGTGAMFVLAFLLAWRLLPAPRPHVRAAPRGAWLPILRDGRFLLLCSAALLAWTVVQAFELVLPISLTNNHGYAPSTWGVFVAINAVSVTVFQVRLTHAARSLSLMSKFAMGVVLMGFPFLLLSISDALPLVVVLVLVYVVGEMLAMPTMHASAAASIPEQRRGAYWGVWGACNLVAAALAPSLGLQINGAAGDAAMWVTFAGLSTLAIALFAIGRRSKSAPTEIGAAAAIPAPSAAAAATPQTRTERQS